jgi:Lipase maturation factor
VVNSLFSSQPFRGHPPRYVRALFYRYQFSEPGQSGVWQRQLLGEYLRPVALGDSELEAYLAEHGFRE